jgi:hypothetical protein
MNNTTKKKLIIIIILILFLLSGIYIFLYKPEQTKNNPLSQVNATIQPDTCIDLYSGNTFWKQKFIKTFPDLKVEKVGFYCRLNNNEQLISFSYSSDNSVEKGQIILMLDMDDKPIKNIKTTICNSEQNIGYLEFLEANSESVSMNCSNEKSLQSAHTHNFDLETFSILGN